MKKFTLFIFLISSLSLVAVIHGPKNSRIYNSDFSTPFPPENTPEYDGPKAPRDLFVQKEEDKKLREKYSAIIATAVAAESKKTYEAIAIKYGCSKRAAKEKLQYATRYFETKGREYYEQACDEAEADLKAATFLKNLGESSSLALGVIGPGMVYFAKEGIKKAGVAYLSKEGLKRTLTFSQLIAGCSAIITKLAIIEEKSLDKPDKKLIAKLEKIYNTSALTNGFLGLKDITDSSFLELIQTILSFSTDPILQECLKVNQHRAATPPTVEELNPYPESETFTDEYLSSLKEADKLKTKVEKFLGSWRGYTWCVNPGGSKKSFSFDIWYTDGVIKCNDYSGSNIFKPAVFSDGILKCTWYRKNSDATGTYNFFIDKKNKNIMNGFEHTDGIRCKHYKYELNRK